MVTDLGQGFDSNGNRTIPQEQTCKFCGEHLWTSMRIKEGQPFRVSIEQCINTKCRPYSTYNREPACFVSKQEGNTYTVQALFDYISRRYEIMESSWCKECC